MMRAVIRARPFCRRVPSESAIHAALSGGLQIALFDRTHVFCNLRARNRGISPLMVPSRETAITRRMRRISEIGGAPRQLVHASYRAPMGAISRPTARPPDLRVSNFALKSLSGELNSSATRSV
jgi:hypothetical protein